LNPLGFLNPVEFLWFGWLILKVCVVDGYHLGSSQLLNQWLVGMHIG
jgi:hypothetical protein